MELSARLLSQASSTADVTPNAYAVSASRQVLLAIAIVELQNSGGDTVQARALLDQCAEFSFITERIAQCLSLPKTQVQIPVVGIGEASPGKA